MVWGDGLLSGLGHSLPAKKAAKGMSSHATGFSSYSKCLCDNLLLWFVQLPGISVTCTEFTLILHVLTVILHSLSLIY